MLDYRENHVRGRNGRLVEVEAIWIAEAERFDGAMRSASAVGASIEEAWATLRADIDGARVRTLSRVRFSSADLQGRAPTSDATALPSSSTLY